MVSDTEKLLEKIKSRGYWRLRLYPLSSKAVVIPTLADCIRIVEEANVTLRGWDYPHISRRNEYERNLDYCALSTDWSYFKEHWRMYQSAQFIHLRGLREDWYDEANNAQPGYSEIPSPGECLNVISSLIYNLTEVFEFISRLAVNKQYSSGINIELSLENTKNRRLWIGDPARIDFMEQYKSSMESILYTTSISLAEAKESPSLNAQKAIEYFYQRFGFDHSTKEQIKSVQAELFGINGNLLH
jgi:hypothetical protein